MILTKNDMSMCEKNSERFGVSLAALMDNAGAALADAAKEYAYKHFIKNVLIITGSGNNGGDGFAAAQILFKSGINVGVLKISEPKTTLAKNACSQLDRKIKIFGYDDAQAAVNSADMIVDAVFGTGFHGEFDTQTKKVFDLVKASKAYKIACDLPSGIDASNGFAADGTAKFNKTVCFHAIKLGMLLSPAKDFCGEIDIRGINIPPSACQEALQITNVGAKEAKSFLPPRPDNAHKGVFGKLLCICGADCYPGAAILSASGALRTGVGLVTLASTEKVTAAASSMLPEATFMTLKSNPNGYISAQNADVLIEKSSEYSAVLIGCGLGKCSDTAHIVKSIVQNSKVPVIIDADGLNCLSENINILKNTKAEVILTPHPFELSRLLGKPADETLFDRFNLTVKLSEEYNAAVISKSAESFAVSSSKRAYLIARGNSALSKGGSGDMLAGMIGSFIAQGVDCAEACALSQFCLGRSAERLSQRVSKRGIIARDILKELPYVLKELED